MAANLKRLSPLILYKIYKVMGFSQRNLVPFLFMLLARILEKFWIAFAVLTLILFVILSLVVGIELYGREMEKVSEAYYRLAKNPLLLGDYRTAMIQLNQALSGGFRRIELRDRDKKIVFSIPVEHFENSIFFERSVTYAVNLDPASDQRSDHVLIFKFSVAHLFFSVCGVWLLVGMFNIPFGLFLRKKMKARYRKKEEERANLEFASLARQAAHDIRSPLSALKILMSKTDIVSIENRKILDSVYFSIMNTADDLLSISLSGRGVSDMGSASIQKKNSNDLDRVQDRRKDVELIDVKRAIVGALSWKKEELSEKYPHVRFSVNDHSVDFQQKILVYGIQGDVVRLISNILNNAFESLSGEGFVSVIVEVSAKECLVEIRDSGVGIVSEDLDRIWDAGISIGKKGGTGLGLFQAKKTVEAMGGKIHIRSGAGVGTTVTIVFKEINESL